MPLVLGRSRGASTLQLVVAIAVLGRPTPGNAQTNAIDWPQAFGTYSRDPYHHRRSLLALRHQVTPDVAPVYLLALADAQLRARHFEAARRTFSAALARGLGEPWASWAQVGLGWAALALDDLPSARAEFGVAAAGEGRTAALAMFVVALLDAADGKPDAEASFARVAQVSESGGVLDRAARLGRAYGMYWASNYAQAARAFDDLAEDPRVGPLRDDALYGAAWSRAHEGNLSEARRALESLAGTGRHRSHGPSALVNLEPQALLHDAIQRYRYAPVRAPEDQITGLLDGDGVTLARAALTWLARDEARGRETAGREPLVVWRGRPDDALDEPAERPDKDSRASTRPARSAPDPQTEIETAATVGTHTSRIMLAVGALACCWWLGRRLIGA